MPTHFLLVYYFKNTSGFLDYLYQIGKSRLSVGYLPERGMSDEERAHAEPMGTKRRAQMESSGCSVKNCNLRSAPLVSEACKGRLQS